MPTTAAKKNTDLTKGPVARSLILFALPLLGSSLVQQLYNTVDLICVGRACGTNASAAVGASSLLITCLVGFFGGLAVGASVLVANLLGAGRKREVKTAVRAAVSLSFWGGIFLTALGLFLAPHFIAWLHTPAEIVPDAVLYLRVYFLSLVFVVMYNMCAGVIRAMGDSASPLRFQLVGGIINVVMDGVFVLAFHMGVAGVAWATLFSQGVAAALALRYLCRMRNEYRLDPGTYRRAGKLRFRALVTGQKARTTVGVGSQMPPDAIRPALQKILSVGVPAGLQSLVITLSNVFAQYHINTLGTTDIAAFTAYFKVELLLYLPIVAIGQAASTFVGQNVGARDFARAKRGTRDCVLLGIALTVCTAALLLVFGKYAFWLFNKDTAVIAEGLKIIRVTFPFYWVYVLLEVYGASIRGAGRATPPMVIILSNICVLRTILLFALVPQLQSAQAVAMCYPITWATTALCMLLYYKKGSWQKAGLVEPLPDTAGETESA